MAAGGYRELVLVAGDLHIPHRAADVADRFRKILQPNKMQHVLCTGNLTSREQQDFLRTLAPRMHLVRGDFDDDESLPETKVVTIGGFRFGLCHGHQVAPVGETESLACLARQLDVDVLVTGATHEHSIIQYEGRCFINPGSLTGAYRASSDLGVVHPSFLVLNVGDASIEMYMYELLPADAAAAPAGGEGGETAVADPAAAAASADGWKLHIAQSMFLKAGTAAAAASGGTGSAAGAGATTSGLTGLTASVVGAYAGADGRSGTTSTAPVAATAGAGIGGGGVISDDAL